MLSPTSVAGRPPAGGQRQGGDYWGTAYPGATLFRPLQGLRIAAEKN